ncbi:SH3 domain-binding glutamic acid-rich-like protein 3 [Clavelina lepadiformis]
MSGLKLYMASVTGNVEIKKKQQKILMTLEGKKFPFEQIDITSDSAKKDEMREIAGDPKALPPQLANGKDYLGDFAAFDEAVENETLEEFLKLK